MILYLLFSIPLAYIVIQLWQLWVLLNYKSKPLQQFDSESLPNVSILVACRNEELNIGKCLDALLALNYPQEKIQIIVGNDESTDRSLEIIQTYAQRHPQIQCINILEDQSGLKAKARVMAQLDEHATGDFYLVTDADVQVNPNWVLGLLSNLEDSMGVASGTTMVKASGTDGWLQEIDWAYFMGLLNVISYSGVPATAVGNNMILRKRAYWDTGGYKNIKFSITEDYKLYSEVCSKGWKWNNIMNGDVLAYSEKTKGFGSLLHQRKRWLSGGKELPWYWWLLFGVYGGFYMVVPILVLSYAMNLTTALTLQTVLIVWLVKWLLQSVQIKTIYKHLQEKPPSLTRLFVYEWYLMVLTNATAIFFMLPLKTTWKERNYKV